STNVFRNGKPPDLHRPRRSRQKWPVFHGWVPHGVTIMAVKAVGWPVCFGREARQPSPPLRYRRDCRRPAALHLPNPAALHFPSPATLRLPSLTRLHPRTPATRQPLRDPVAWIWLSGLPAVTHPLVQHPRAPRPAAAPNRHDLDTMGLNSAEHWPFLPRSWP